MYSKEEVLAASIEYFNGDELAASVFADKYALRDKEGNFLEKNPSDMHRRIAKEFARIEKKKFKEPMSEEEIFGYLDQFKWIVPQGSPLQGIGNKYSYQTLGNCYVLGNVEDSYGGIFYADQQLGQLMKRRAGVGMDISNIRPKGMNVQNAAKSTDGISIFIDRFSNTCKEVAQGGRRGALMLSINVHHPEVSTFINIKKDLKRVTGANISVRLTDAFLNAVEKDEEYEQFWPITGEKKISNKVKAKEIWNQIIDAAWSAGEPGVMFWDTILDNSLSNRYGEINPAFFDLTSNPCQPSWAKVLTKEGIRTIGDINIGEDIWSSDGWTKVINKWSNGIKKVNKYATTAGIFYGTENHKVVSDGEKIEVKDAESIDILRGIYESTYTIDPQDVMDGVVFGDGSIHKASNDLVYLYIGQNDTDYFDSEIKELILKHRPGLKDTAYEIKTTIISEELAHTYLRKIPSRFMFNKNKLVGFLRGLYTANGSVCGNRITLKASSKQVIEDVQLMLSSIGIKSYYTTNNQTEVKFTNGSYICKQSYDLNITCDREKFVKSIGFIQEYKNDKIKLCSFMDKKSTYDINKVEFVSEEEVFDITVDNKSHTYWSHGCNISNCGEIIMGKDSCRLMIVPLNNFVTNPFTKDAYFDFIHFGKIVEKGQRLMDSIIDLELECIDRIINKIKSDKESNDIKKIELSMWEQIKEVCEQGRRTGLGINALADTLASLNIKYGSDESFNKVNEIFKIFGVHSMKSSCEMAKELGAFPLYNKELEAKYPNPLLDRIFDASPEVKKLHDKYGRRNISLTTCSPTGSISLLTRTSSGIEPLFTLKPYTRRKKINPDNINVKEDFIDDMGDKWQEYKVYHPYLDLWMKITGKTNSEESPYFGATSDCIDWERSVKIQAIGQKWISHSISKTVNAPKDISKDITEKVYLTAWKEKCKGITFYRDGSRAGVLINGDKKDDCDRSTPKRPKEVSCEVFHTKVSKKLDKLRYFEYIVFIGLVEGKVYELFAIENGKYDKNNTKGKIIKHGRGDYEVILEDGTSIKDITKDNSEMEEVLTRMISTSLRHRVPVQFVVEQLSKVSGDLFGFAKCISRALKKYISNGTKSSDKCTCGNKYIFESGCYVCPSCGASKC